MYPGCNNDALTTRHLHRPEDNHSSWFSSKKLYKYRRVLETRIEILGPFWIWYNLSATMEQLFDGPSSGIEVFGKVTECTKPKIQVRQKSP
jgi:hypothetical protein